MFTTTAHSEAPSPLDRFGVVLVLHRSWSTVNGQPQATMRSKNASHSLPSVVVPRMTRPRWCQTPLKARTVTFEMIEITQRSIMSPTRNLSAQVYPCTKTPACKPIIYPTASGPAVFHLSITSSRYGYGVTACNKSRGSRRSLWHQRFIDLQGALTEKPE